MSATWETSLTWADFLSALEAETFGDEPADKSNAGGNGAPTLAMLHHET